MAAIAHKLALGSTLRAANLVATAVVSVLMMPLIVHSLGDRMYGIWTLVASFIGYYGLLELGLSTAISRYIAAALGAGDEEESNRVFNTALRIYLVLGGVALVVTALVASLASPICKNSQDASIFGKVILILGLSVAVTFPVRVFKGVLEAHLRFDRTAALDLLGLALRNLIIIVVLRLGYKVVALALVTLLCGLPSMALHLYYCYRDLPFLCFDAKYWRRSTARSLFSYSVFSLVAHLADVLRFQVDNLVVAAFVGLAAVTHYSIAGRLVQYFTGIMAALVGIFPSVFSRQEGAKDYEGIKRTFLFASRISVCISSFVAFGLIAWGRSFIVRWMGPQYVDAYPCLAALVLGSTLAQWQSPSVGLLYGLSKHKFFAVLSSVEGFANLALSILLAQKYGIVGVALGTMIPITFTKLLIQPVYVCRVAGIELLDYLRRTGRTLVVVLVSLSIPALIAARFARPDYTKLFSIGLFSLVLYTALLWRFEFSSEETRLMQRAIWPRVTESRLSIKPVE